jgi:hypothetical protein
MKKKRHGTNTHDSIFRVVRAISLFDAGVYRTAREAQSRKSTRIVFWLLLVCPFAVLVGVAGFQWFTGDASFRVLALYALLTAYIGILLTSGMTALFHRKTILRNLLDPYHQIWLNAYMTASIDDRYLKTLMRRNLASLDFCLSALKSERDHFERRIGAVIGAVHKIGLAPAVLGAIAAVSELVEKKLPWWVMSIAYAIPFLYLVAMRFEPVWMRLDRCIRLFEHVIATKKAAKAPPEQFSGV